MKFYVCDFSKILKLGEFLRFNTVVQTAQNPVFKTLFGNSRNLQSLETCHHIIIFREEKVEKY